MRGPGGFSGGKVFDAMVSQIDLFPTICDLLGIAQPHWLQGTSLMPLIREEKSDVRDSLFAECTFHAAYEPQRAIRTKRWKYIRRFIDRKAPVLANCDDSLSKDVWMEYGWRERQIAPEHRIRVAQTDVLTAKESCHGPPIDHRQSDDQRNHRQLHPRRAR